MHRLLPLAAFFLLGLVRPRLPVEPPAPLADGRELASLVPERCQVFVDASGLLPMLEQGLEHAFLEELRASEIGAALRELPLAPEAALRAADAWLGAPVLDAAAGLAARGLCFGYEAGSKKTIALALARDAEAAAQHFGRLLDAIERQFGIPGALDAPQRRWSGADVWSLGDAAFLARRDGLVVLGNDGELVADALELADDPEGRGLLDRPGFASAPASAREGATLAAWLDLAALEPHGDDGFRELRRANRTPAVQGLLGARVGSLLSARTLSASLTLDGGRAELRLRGGDAPCALALAPGARERAVPADPGAAGVASALVYRDWSRWFSLRSELFPAEALPAFAEAVTNGALFFEGRDLGEEVLSQLSPWIRLVSAEIEYAEGRRPEIALPGVAAIAVLDDARAGEAWVAAFQSLVSIVNVEQAQKGGRSMRLVVAREGDVDVTAARFPTPADGEGVDVRYNLEPALAVVGRHLVVGAHEALVREIVRGLAGREPLAPDGARETLEVDGRAVAAALERNAEVLVARKMVTDGLGRAEAERELSGLRRALASIERARVAVGGEDASPELALELRLRRAEGGR